VAGASGGGAKAAFRDSVDKNNGKAGDEEIISGSKGFAKGTTSFFCLLNRTEVFFLPCYICLMPQGY